MLGNNPEESIQHSEFGTSLKSRIFNFLSLSYNEYLPAYLYPYTHIMITISFSNYSPRQYYLIINLLSYFIIIHVHHSLFQFCYHYFLIKIVFTILFITDWHFVTVYRLKYFFSSISWPHYYHDSHFSPHGHKWQCSQTPSPLSSHMLHYLIWYFWSCRSRWPM